MLSKLIQRFMSSYESRGNPPHIDERKIVAAMLQAQVRTCTVCQQPFSSPHSFAQVASVVVGPSETPSVAELINAAKDRNWQSLTTFKEWKGDRDNMVSYAIRCSNGGGMLAHIYDPNELSESNHLYQEETLSIEEMKALERLIPESRWNTF